MSSRDTLVPGARRGRTEVPGAIAFAVTVTTEDEARIVRVAGDLDGYSSPQLRAVLLDLADGPGRVIVDVAGAGFIDSTGLGVLVGGMRRLRQHRVQMVLRAPTRAVARLLEVTGVNTLFEIV